MMGHLISRYFCLEAPNWPLHQLHNSVDNALPRSFTAHILLLKQHGQSAIPISLQQNHTSFWCSAFATEQSLKLPHRQCESFVIKFLLLPQRCCLCLRRDSSHPSIPQVLKICIPNRDNPPHSLQLSTLLLKQCIPNLITPLRIEQPCPQNFLLTRDQSARQWIHMLHENSLQRSQRILLRIQAHDVDLYIEKGDGANPKAKQLVFLLLSIRRRDKYGFREMRHSTRPSGHELNFFSTSLVFRDDLGSAT